MGVNEGKASVFAAAHVNKAGDRKERKGTRAYYRAEKECWMGFRRSPSSMHT